MKAILLCGGQGTRLREHTELKPKPMVEIGSRPILWHIMKSYSHYGITEFVLCLGYKAAAIKEYFLNYNAMMTDFTVTLGKSSTVEIHKVAAIEERWQVTLADTGEDTITGARVHRAAPYFSDDETFLVTYGDGVADINIKELVDFHKSHGKLATLTGVRPPSKFGELQCAGESVLSFSEKPLGGQGLVNGGFFCFQRDFLRYLTSDSGCVLEQKPLESCARDGQLCVYEHNGFWQCMDTFRDWTLLESMWKKDAAPWKVWQDSTSPAVLPLRTKVEKAA